ncbi:DNA repair protein RadC [Prosthecochloris sp. N3]|uniref:DNA repair protein RadC n=1 Tax=Prosthecochloris ethylica TaxID=2743976 RepID=A0ABR9XS93_9CHLB|nr:DNA repair protein RadC [Prosthecochloris ethylica]MBF0586779.1 DNA repair protein RadC [Prosthecochloris ethylica]MBF0636685.1 DNA repair protein RadC [Prosthecochloris ethylica]MEC9486613.1 DNA repair protein RadC [Prosthecochloris sp.]NUK47916.1 DNA repair protein RadC [Prosthecochloris ethylica]
MRIHDLDPEHRPRERFLQSGPAALSSAELMALILKTGTRHHNIVDTCQAMISRHGLERLAELSLGELQDIPGIGPAKAMQIKAVFELQKRVSFIRHTNKKVRSAKDVYEYMTGRVPDEHREHLFLLHLNTKNHIIRHDIISVGTLNASLIHPREIFKPAIRESAHAVILVHNHPSGDVEPSNADRQVTATLKKASAILQIELLDHVIVGCDSYFSFREHSLLA